MHARAGNAGGRGSYFLMLLLRPELRNAGAGFICCREDVSKRNVCGNKRSQLRDGFRCINDLRDEQEMWSVVTRTEGA